MSDLTYSESRNGPKDKPLAWLYGEIKTPPFSKEARIEAGYLHKADAEERYRSL
jgi:hypothetical protein